MASNLGAPFALKKHRLDPEEDGARRRRKIAGGNARFDRMIETMSTIHTPAMEDREDPNPRKTRRVRRSKQFLDAYSPLPAVHLKHGLSFIKMDGPMSPISIIEDDQGPSSDSVSQPSAAARRRTCNPLPSWLANTFMTLSKRHPLRLLLPSELSQNAPEEITYPHAVELSAQTYDSSDDSASHLPTHSDPELKPTFREPLLPTFRSRHSTPHDDAVMYPASGSLCGTSPTVFGQSLPFSTPGPGSAVTARSIFSVPSPQSGSSPTLCHPLSHHEDGQRHPAVTELYQPSIAAVNPYYHFNDQADYDDSGPALADLPDNPYVSSVYSTPGPTFCAPFFHFDSPTEDPLTPAAEDLGSSEFTNVLDLNEVGFHWAPFDRKQIIAPSIPETQAFRAHGTSTASRPVRDSLDYDKSITPTISHNGTSPHDPVAGDNTSAFPIASQTHLEETTTVKPPVSPSPFRFSPSVTDYQLEPVVTASESDPIFISPSPSTGAYHVPESQGQPQVHRNSSQRLILKHAQAQTPPPQNIPFAPRPGVYISPIEYSPKESTKPRTAENGKDIQASLHRNLKSRNMLKTGGNLLDILDQIDGDMAENGRRPQTQVSQTSHDSIESWQD